MGGMPPPVWGGIGCPDGGSPRREGAGCPGVTRGVDESQAGVPRAGGVEEMDQASRHPGWLVVSCSWGQ